MSTKADFFNFDRDSLSEFLKSEYSLPPYRAEQLFKWVYRSGVYNFSLMTDLSKTIRQDFSQKFTFPKASIQKREISNDGTRKYVLSLEGNHMVEAVMIKQASRMTLCLSSQVGCGMGCGFCRTATMGFKRNLSTSEIIQQVLAVKEDAKNFSDMFQNIVFMGMGEPLHNFKAVTTALRILKDDKGFRFSGRKITLSSVGLVPAINKFGETGIDVNLAISLNATTDDVRSSIMPINRAFPISKLFECLHAFPLKARKRITIEYVLLSGVNDTDADLRRLPKLVHRLPVKINLIPYNVNAGLGFLSPTRDRILYWQKELTQKGLSATIRWSKGIDIKAACGQLVTSPHVTGTTANSAVQ